MPFYRNRHAVLAEFAFFDGCEIKIARQAKESFEAISKDMDKVTREKSFKRLNDELDVIIGNGYFHEYYLFTNIVQYALNRRRFISVQGLAAYSYVAYLLGITTVNPVERNYPMEMLFGYYHDRSPLFNIHAAPSFKQDIIDFLYDKFGKESVYVDGFMVSLKGADEAPDTLNRMFFSIFDREIIDKAEKLIIHSKVDGITLQNATGTFDIDRLSILQPAFPSGKMKNSEIVLKDRIKELMSECLTKDESYFDADTVEKCFDTAWDGTYEGYLNAFAMVYGTGVLEADLRTAGKTRLYTRDDFYKYGISVFGNEKDTWDFVGKVRKGRGKEESFQAYLDEHGVPKDIRDGIRKIGYVMSEGALIPDVQLFLFCSGCLAKQ